MDDAVTNGSREAVELCGIRTCVPRVRSTLELIRRFGGLDAPVLIQGETGTGKELVARALHALSTRNDRPLVTIECAALPETLAESELFGHERGAFTGADRTYCGRIQAAAGGTLFLDEVNSISIALQAKLLRFLEQGEVCRVGQQRPVPVDVRLIAASNATLEKVVAAGAMRADFFHRLNVLRIEMPPLRERLDDLPLLVQQFLAEDPEAVRSGVIAVSANVMAQLRGLPWPGNVRELRNLLRRSIAFQGKGQVLGRLEVPVGTTAPEPPPTASVAWFRSYPFRAWMRECERQYLADLVERYRSTSQRVAASGLPERTLYRKLRGFGLRTPADDVDDVHPPAQFPNVGPMSGLGSPMVARSASDAGRTSS